MSLRYEGEMETAKAQGELAERRLFTGKFQEAEPFAVSRVNVLKEPDLKFLC